MKMPNTYTTCTNCSASLVINEDGKRVGGECICDNPTPKKTTR
jgi:hypothetical protein